MIHHCPSCRGFSQHGEGACHWALTCPFCGTVAPQAVEPPDTPTTPTSVAESTESDDTTTVDPADTPDEVEVYVGGLEGFDES